MVKKNNRKINKPDTPAVPTQTEGQENAAPPQTVLKKGFLADKIVQTPANGGKKNKKCRICLNMIVKDEEEIILGCLKNVCHLLLPDENGEGEGCIAILDTGSSDRTVKIINNFMLKNGIKGEVMVKQFSDFGVSRTEALRYGEDVCFRISKGLLGPAGQCLTDYKPPPPKRWKPRFITEMLTLEEFLKHPKAPDSKSRDLTKYDGAQFLEERLAEHKNSDLGDDRWYLMFMDADNELRVKSWDPNCKEVYQVDKEKMIDETYSTQMKQGPISYKYCAMVKVNREKPWIWNKKIHEHVVPCKWENPKRGQLVNCYILSGRSGARSKDPCKYLKDAVICEREVLADPNDEHYVFYGSQSYRDFGSLEQSMKWYLKRATMKGWTEQVYISYLEAGKLQMRLDDKNLFKALPNLLRGFQETPNRLEAPFFILQVYLQLGLPRVGWEFAKPLLDVKTPDDLLFIDTSIHNWQFFQVSAASAHQANDFAAAVPVAEKALSAPDIPKEVAAGLINMINDAKSKIPPAAPLKPADKEKKEKIKKENKVEIIEASDKLETEKNNCN